MKTLAYALKKPLVGISSLMAQVHAMPPVSGLVCPVMDARNQQVFTAVFRNIPEIIRLNEEAGIPVLALAEQLKHFGEEVLLVGDAAEMYAQMLHETTGLTIRVASSNWFTPRAASVALLAEKEFEQGGHESGAFDVNPHYLRKSQAERLKKQPGGEETP
jgi:tRNA threonylcarbamoyladenosine biosynthesis protein TsaB